MRTARPALSRPAVHGGDGPSGERRIACRPPLLDRCYLLLERLADITLGICPFCWEAAQSGRWVEHVCPLEVGYPIV